MMWKIISKNFSSVHLLHKVVGFIMTFSYKSIRYFYRVHSYSLFCPLFTSSLPLQAGSILFSYHVYDYYVCMCSHTHTHNITQVPHMKEKLYFLEWVWLNLPYIMVKTKNACCLQEMKTKTWVKENLTSVPLK